MWLYNKNAFNKVNKMSKILELINIKFILQCFSLHPEILYKIEINMMPFRKLYSKGCESQVEEYIWSKDSLVLI